MFCKAPRGSPRFASSGRLGPTYGSSGRIGTVADTSVLSITGRDGTRLIDVDVHTLREAWTRPLDW